MRRGILMIAAMGLMLAGCSSGSDSKDAVPASAPVLGLGSPTTTSVQSTLSADLIPKAVGEEGGLGCGAGAPADCVNAIVFSVTDISEAAGCSQLPNAGEAFLRVGGAASVSDTVEGDMVAVGTLINVGNWSVVGADGYTTTNLEAAVSCDYRPGPFYDTVRPGTKQRGDIVFAVPEDAERLVLAIPGRPGGWEWTIPSLKD